MTTVTTTPVLLYRAAKQTFTEATIRFKQADEALGNINTPAVRAEWSAAFDAQCTAEDAYHLAYDAAYPQADIEITSAHVIVRKLGLANLLEADRIVKEQHAAGNLKFSRVFRGEAKRIADVENAEILA
jgi:hypothetical protein